MKKVKIVGYVFLVVLLVLFILNYSNLRDFVNVYFEEQIGVWGYAGVFVIAYFLEMIPQPLISAIWPFMTGLLFDLNYFYLFLVIVVSFVAGNYSAYFIGRRYGKKVVGIFIREKSYDKGVLWFCKYGKIGMTLLALTPIPYFPILGGIFKMSFRDFTLYAIVPRFFHFLIFCSLIVFFV